MKLSVWSNYFHQLTPEEKVDAFTECGYNYLEVSTEDGEDLLARGNHEQVGKKYGNYARERGITPLQGHLFLSADILNQNDRSALKSWLELFYNIGIENCVLHYRKWADSDIVAEKLLLARSKALEELVSHVQGTKMVLCLENLVSSNDATAAPLLELIEVVRSPHLGICLDTGHLNISGGNAKQFILDSGVHLKALHIADNEGITDQHMMPYGRGTVNWDEFMTALNQTSYEGLFNFEIPGESNAPLPVLKAKLKYLKEMAQFMEQL